MGKETLIDKLMGIKDISRYSIKELVTMTGYGQSTIYRIVKKHGIPVVAYSIKDKFMEPKNTILGIEVHQPDKQIEVFKRVRAAVRARTGILVTDDDFAKIMGVGSGLIDRWQRPPNSRMYKKMGEKEQRRLLFEIKERLARLKQSKKRTRKKG
ncbi:MAG: hypothetical protein KKG99_17395 [Bacteroidetes bacterium]|nr:hypothetical protein [Bacteroidota bacterium]